MISLCHSVVFAQDRSEIIENIVQDQDAKLPTTIAEAAYSGGAGYPFVLSRILAKLLEFSFETKRETGRIPNEQELKTMARIYRARRELKLFTFYPFNLDNTDIEFLERTRRFTEQTKAETGEFPTVREMEDQFLRLAQQDYQFSFAYENEHRRGHLVINHIDSITESELIEIKEEREPDFFTLLSRIFKFDQHLILVNARYEETLLERELDIVEIGSTMKLLEFITLLDSLSEITEDFCDQSPNPEDC